MKKYWILLLLLFIVTFSACAVKETLSLECVTDSHDPKTIPTFYIAADIPHGAFLSDSCKEGCCALFTHEDYEVMQEIFVAKSLDEAFVYLTGKNCRELKAIEVNDFPQKEYRFAWTAAGEEGELSCVGMLFSDGTYYYSICIYCNAEAEKFHTKDFEQIFTGTELLAL